MKIKEVTIEVSYLHPMKAFQSYKATVSMTAEVEDGDNEGDVLRHIRESCKEEIKTQIAELKGGANE